MPSLAVKYRPKTFEEVLGQEVVVEILKRQLEAGHLSHCYLFAGPSGDGKTTLARILAREINGGEGHPIEIDGASNNGVDNVRAIIEDSYSRALEGQYKIFIVDECHQITVAGWNAFLKCLEEPPQYTIFMFCTTDPQKLPATILNRVMRFNLSRVSDEDILSRLAYICQEEGVSLVEKEALTYIAKLAEGSVRDAITNLEYVLEYAPEVSLNNVQKALGYCPQDLFFELTNAIVDGNRESVATSLESLLESISPTDFLHQYISFVLDLVKYCLFYQLNVTSIPQRFTEELNYTVGVKPTREESAEYFRELAEKLLEVRTYLAGGANAKEVLLILLLGA